MVQEQWEQQHLHCLTACTTEACVSLLFQLCREDFCPPFDPFDSFDSFVWKQL